MDDAKQREFHSSEVNDSISKVLDDAKDRELSRDDVNELVKLHQELKRMAADKIAP